MSNPLPMLNGEKTGVDFSTDASVNMVAAIHDHISCTKPVQADTFVTQDSKAGILYPCDFDHMYASLAEGTVVERENLEVKHLKELLLLHLDLIQQQSEQLVTKDKQISSLRQENETLRQRLERMDRRVTLHKQRDGLVQPSDTVADRSTAAQPADGALLVPKLESDMLRSSSPSVVLSPMPATQQQYYRPPTPFPGRLEQLEEPKQSPSPVSHDHQGSDTRVPRASPAAAALANFCNFENESAKRRRTEEREALPRAPSSPGLPASPGTERVTAQDSDDGDKFSDEDASPHGDERHRRKSGSAWMSYTRRNHRRRLQFRHGRSSESCGRSPSRSPPHSESHLNRGRGRRLLRGRHRGRGSCGRSNRRSKDVLSTDHPYWTPIGEWPLALRVHDTLGVEGTTVEVPSWRHKVYTSCYAMEGTENLDDEVFSKRHQRYESDERRRKRWDVQRIREQRHVEKLRQQEAARSAPPVGGHRRGDDCPLATLWPGPEDVTFVEIGDRVPVAAFGAPVSNFAPNEFSLPWKWRPGTQEKSLRRGHDGPYSNRDDSPNRSPDAPAASGATRR